MVFLPASPTRLFSLSNKKRSASRNTPSPVAPSDDTPRDTMVKHSSKRTSAIVPSELVMVDRAQDPLASPGLPEQPQDGARSTQEHLETADIPPEDMMDTVAIVVPVDTGSPVQGNSTSALGAESSAFDQASESEDSEIDDDTVPVMGRASSVRVSRPQIVQHKLSVSKRSTRSSSQNLSPSQEHLPEGRNSTLPTMPEESLQSVAFHGVVGSSPRRASIDEFSADTRQGSGTRPGPSFLIESPDSARRRSTGTSFDFDEGLRTGDTLRSHQASLSEASERAITETTPTPDLVDGTTTLVAPTTQEISAVELPRFESIASPKPGLSRRVTIRPSDLITPSSKHGSSTFRQSIVTTPYPPRSTDERRLSESDSTNSMTFPAGAASVSLTGQKLLSPPTEDNVRTTQVDGPLGTTVNFMPPTPGERDRFPSPSRSETLFLDLGLAAHPGARVTLEIQVIDKCTFDDEELFLQIRRSYHRQLLGARRWPFSLFRKVGHVSISGGSMGSFEKAGSKSFDAVDFTKHFLRPSLGNRRKTWTTWLRSHNPHTARRYSESHSARPFPSQLPTSPNRLLSNGKEIRHISNIKSLRSRPSSEVPVLSHSRQPSSNTTQAADIHRTSSAKAPSRSHSRASSFNFIYSPLVPRLPFLRTPPGHSRSTTIHTTFPGLQGSELNEKSNQAVTIVFHHRFSVLMCSLLTLLVILGSLLSATIWVIFGTPGSRPGEETYTPVIVPISAPPGSISRPVAGDSHAGMPVPSTPGSGSFGIEYVKADWHVDARARVLTGAVVGLVVFLVGSAVECGLILGGKVLL